LTVFLRGDVDGRLKRICISRGFFYFLLRRGRLPSFFQKLFFVSKTNNVFRTACALLLGNVIEMTSIRVYTMAKNMAEIGKEKKMFFRQFHPKKTTREEGKEKGLSQGFINSL
jgi:hypothetical protein